MDITEAARDDHTTFDNLKGCCQGQKEKIYLGQGQLELIDFVGLRNRILRKM